ncbi:MULTISPECIES: AidA/PixA family protein [Flavobacterium]|jgi:hypothetical protein|uniref:AidA/PixA family protein n=1 Tax=Flavobacterium cupriresistens TaxID=2893885 RepID=A0ABU4RH54_9FLAO|nr:MULTISPECIES: AidA/PixA family protein [unclassified Flavobacterium]KLT68008.1 hypothetical protein AB674_19900 [Flavobacterium sp. ABG]MDX6191907.1 AidA/PixA family protein [Flavobacterium sp. Fl-318]UFH41836.1 inclusion body family protein [Flavobacterium sp. F-323]
MGLINILVAVDGTQLAEQVANGKIKPGTKTSPTSLGAWSQSDVYIAMISQHNNVVNNEGQSELKISANSGDTVQWAMTTFGNNVDNTAFLYAGSFSPSGAILPSGLLYFNSQTAEHLPNNSGTLQEFTNNVYLAQGTVIQVGVKIQYTLSFQLVNNANGNVIGYFSWDPFIDVNQG